MFDEAVRSGMVSPPRKSAQDGADDSSQKNDPAKPTPEEVKAAQEAAEKEKQQKRKQAKMRQIEMEVMQYQQACEAAHIKPDVIAMKCDKKRMELLEAWSNEEAMKDMQTNAKTQGGAESSRSKKEPPRSTKVAKESSRIEPSQTAAPQIRKSDLYGTSSSATRSDSSRPKVTEPDPKKSRTEGSRDQKDRQERSVEQKAKGRDRDRDHDRNARRSSGNR